MASTTSPPASDATTRRGTGAATYPSVTALPSGSGSSGPSVSVERRTSRAPLPHSAIPPLLTSGVERCGGAVVSSIRTVNCSCRWNARSWQGRRFAAPTSPTSHMMSAAKANKGTSTRKDRGVRALLLVVGGWVSGSVGGGWEKGGEEEGW